MVWYDFPLLTRADLTVNLVKIWVETINYELKIGEFSSCWTYQITSEISIAKHGSVLQLHILAKTCEPLKFKGFKKMIRKGGYML